MNEMTVMGSRLNKLEQDNLLLKLGIVSLLLVLAAVSCAGGLMPQQMQQMVRAHGFEVINTNGTRRAVMSDQGIS